MLHKIKQFPPIIYFHLLNSTWLRDNSELKSTVAYPTTSESLKPVIALLLYVLYNGGLPIVNTIGAHLPMTPIIIIITQGYDPCPLHLSTKRRTVPSGLIYSITIVSSITFNILLMGDFPGPNFRQAHVASPHHSYNRLGNWRLLLLIRCRDTWRTLHWLLEPSAYKILNELIPVY